MSPRRSNLASANDQDPLKFKNQGNYRFILRIFALHFLKDTQLCICRNEIFCSWVTAKVIYLRNSSHIFKILPNVRSTINVKMQYKSAKTLSGLQVPKIKCYYLHNASPYVESFTFTLSDLPIWCSSKLNLVNLGVMPILR